MENTTVERKSTACTGCDDVKKIAKRLPSGWKHVGEGYWCSKCWAAKYILRAISFPVVAPVGHTWQELRSALREMFIETTAVSNWMMTELYTRDVRREPGQTKMPPMPRTYLYPEARRIAPNLPPQCVAALEQAITRKYRAKRFEVVWTHRSSLPTIGYPSPFPVHNQSWSCELDGDNRPAVSVRLKDQRWTLRLRGGPQFHRQRKAYDQMLSGEAVRGELALYERGDDLICKLVAWLPRTEREARQEGTLIVHTDKDSLLVAVNPKDVKLWSYHGDHLRRWSTEHRAQLKRWNDDQQYEQRLIPTFAERRERATAKYRNRMNSACHEIAAQLTSYAARRHFAAVQYNDREHAFCDEFPWAKLRRLLDQKMNAYGIELRVANPAIRPEVQQSSKRVSEAVAYL